MSKTITPVYLANNDTVVTLLTRVNNAIDFISSEAVSANATANGAQTTGNGFITGIFGSNTIVATTLRGGNVQSSANLSISSNLISSANIVVISNSTYSGIVLVGNTAANSTTLKSDTLNVGSNFVVNSTSIVFNNTIFSSLSSMIVVANSGANVGTIGRLNLIAGAQSYINATANANTSSIDITIGFVANGTIGAAGTNSQVQFNDNGAANALNSFIFNKTSNTITVTGNVVTTGIVLVNQFDTSKVVNVIVANTNTIIDSFVLTDYRSAEYLLSITDNAANNFVLSKLIGLQDLGNFYLTEYAVLTSNSTIGSYIPSSNATHAILSYNTVTSANVTIKMSRTLIGV